MESIDALQGALERFSGGVITVSHDERFINSVCNEIWICEDGLLKKFAGTIKDYKVRIVKEKERGCITWYSLPIFHYSNWLFPRINQWHYRRFHNEDRQYIDLCDIL